jgi:hypothetical protein
VATGVFQGQATEKKARVDFLAFMDLAVQESPPEKELRVILDNCCIHKNCDTWPEQHPNVFFHYTPTSASWLSLVEVWSGIFSRKALRVASFESIDELTKAIHDFIEVYNPKAEPFIWRKREVRESQLKNTIANLCN